MIFFVESSCPIDVIVVILPIHQHNNIGVLLDGAGFLEVAKLRDVPFVVFHATV
jgi:hypothetical protein